MTDSEDSAVPQTTNGRPGTGTPIRIAIYAVAALAMAAVFVVRQDRVVANQRANTIAAWNAALVADTVFVASGVDETVIGEPVVGEMVASSNVPMARKHRVYTWNGPLNAYRATLYFNASPDPIVVKVQAE